MAISHRRRTPRTKQTKRQKMQQVMHEYKEGELHIGKSAKKVKSRKQAVAIALKESGQSKYQK